MLLICKYASGSVAFHAAWIGGAPAPERRYYIDDYKIVLDGYAEGIVQHDTSALLAMPNELYRMPTPHEQEVFASKQAQSITIQENAQQKTEELDNTPAIPPALPKSKKKASGD